MTDFRNQLPEELAHLKRYALFLSRDRNMSDDLVQDCVVTAMAHCEQFRENMPLRPWLFAIMRNTFFNGLRRAKQASAYQQALVDRDTSASNCEQEIRIEMSELQAALNRISFEHRDIVMRIVVEGFSYTETAQSLRIPVGTVRSRLARARVNLQAELGHVGVPPSIAATSNMLREQIDSNVNH